MAIDNNLTIKQFRYYGPLDERNYPSKDTIWFAGVDDPSDNEIENLLTNNSAIKIGIQGLPGTTFYLNNDTPDGIVIDHTGVYELDLRDTTARLTALSFDEKSLIKIGKTDNAILIVDLLCYTDKTNSGAVNN